MKASLHHLELFVAIAAKITSGDADPQMPDAETIAAWKAGITSVGYELKRRKNYRPMEPLGPDRRVNTEMALRTRHYRRTGSTVGWQEELVTP